ncbi:MAG: class II aldolase/adducin family protein [Proteobacteria bacterium]|nr:class II aldolase/adducin family protein [Pseudomonadota bacterium]MBI3499453.1 class II aldolase/adducin family protein [Pseudomonadota bacterium]
MTGSGDAGTLPASDLIDELVIGNKILSHQKVVDAFGHLSVRHDKDPTRYLMSRHLAPGLVTEADIVTFDLDSNPIVDKGQRYYSERYIHGEIYKARPEIVAVVHCHARELIPYGATGTLLRPIFHMSGFLGAGVPIFEIREAAGMTNMLVRTPALGKALAKSLGDKPVVLMRGHGATMVGKSIKQVVYRSIYASVNAQLQMDAVKLGQPIFLADEEAKKAAEANDGSLDRAWNYWKHEALGE